MSGNDFVRGRTNNHLTFVLVDATDFASPESALSAACKIKIYGKLRGATDANFVSSGTGSLTNDIKHVGPSVTGMYTIALAKADLSDASAAWYDQYVVSLSATGAAYQTLICDGGIDVSALLAGGTQINSRVLLAASAISDIDSALTSQFNSISDAVSNAYSAAAQGASRTLLALSAISDVDSALTSQFAVPAELGASTMSDLRSAINGVTAVLSASDVSDIASAVGDTLASRLSDILSAAVQTNSRVLVAQSMISDVDSALSSQFAATSDAISNAYSAAAQGSSRTLLALSAISDVDSALSSQFTAMSALTSDAHSAAMLAASYASDVYSALTANRAEPAQGAPGASISTLSKLDFLYKAWRNKTEQTATQYSLYDDAGTTIDHKATVSDDATTFTRSEIATGP